MPNNLSTLLDRLTPAQVKRARILRAYHDVFDTPQGKIVLRDLASKHGLLSTSMFRAEENPDGAGRALTMAFAEGERNVVLGLLDSLSVDWDKFINLMQEDSDSETNEYAE